MQVHFTLLQYALLVTYVLGTLAIGLRFAWQQKDVSSYYLAERSAPAWAVAISIISADTSAISYLGCAALVFTGDLQLMVGALAYPLAAVFVALVFVPFLAKQKVFTVYEYLEGRFDIRVRSLASLLFMLMRGSHLAVALFAASLVLAQLLNIPPWTSLLVLGGLTTLYTVLGGMKAVLWTDVTQFFVLVGGLFAILWGVADAFHWNLSSIWQIASAHAPAGAPWLGGKPDVLVHTKMFDFGLSAYRMTFWAVMLSSFLQGVGSYGSDQVLVQRYLAAGSRKAMMGSLIGGGLLQIPILALLFGTGVVLLAFYDHFLHLPGYEWTLGMTDPNRVMTHYLSHGLPGMLGALVIAGLFAGTMSSFSAGLNSLSTTTYVDFVTRFWKAPRDQKTGVRRAKIVTCLWGALVMGSAVLMGGGDTILAILAKVMSPFAGPLLSIFLLGMLSKRARSADVMIATAIGFALTAYVTYFTGLHWIWYFVVGTFGTGISGLLLGALRPAPKHSN